MAKKLDIEDVKKKTEKKQKELEAENRKKEEEKKAQIETVSDVVVENLLEKLPGQIDIAIESGGNHVRIYSSEFRWSYDPSKYAFQPVDVLKLNALIYSKLSDALRKKGFIARRDKGYPHSEEVYEEWIEIRW